MCVCVCVYYNYRVYICDPPETYPMAHQLKISRPIPIVQGPYTSGSYTYFTGTLMIFNVIYWNTWCTLKPSYYLARRAAKVSVDA